MANLDDLAETARQVKAIEGSVVTKQADVRDQQALREAIDGGSAELGAVDIVVANAGIITFGCPDDDWAFRDLLEVNLIGVWNTVRATAPGMIERGNGGAIVLTSSTQGLSGRGGDGSGAHSGYTASKHGIVGLMRAFANWLAPHSIRINSVHPTGVQTPMVDNELGQKLFVEEPGLAEMASNLMPVEMIHPVDVSHAIAWLVSDEARYVTGVALPVDAGFTVK